MSYEMQDWENLPKEKTPISAERLHHMEEGIYAANTAIIRSYQQLTDKPMIEGIALMGNLTLADLGIENYLQDTFNQWQNLFLGGAS